MAHIARKDFTGHVGPVRFIKGHAETDDADVIAFCASRPEYDVTDSDPYTELTDEQVAEAYATNVAGRATKRDSQVDALKALDQE